MSAGYRTATARTRLRALPLAAAALGLLLAASARADEALAAGKGCLTCHQIAAKSIGPAFNAVAERYRNDGKAPAALAAKIRAGGSGAWGTDVMPPNPHVSEADSARLAAWILARP